MRVGGLLYRSARGVPRARKMNHLAQFIAFLRYVARRAEEDRLLQVASSLTFTTLLSLVPLITIAAASIAAFPAFSGIATDFKIFLLTTMVPETAGKVITVYMEQFADAAAKLTAVGTAFLAVTAMMLVHTIFDAFNMIWRVKRRRPLAQRVMIYWTILTLGPLLVGLSISLTSWVVSASLGVTAQVPAIGELVLRIAPVVLSTLAFTLMFVAVPNRHVPWRHALLGGLLAAAAFEAMKRGFAFYIAHFPTQELIYGAFASIPIFLLWIYFSWLAILLGAVIAASLSAWPLGGGRGEAAPGERFRQGLGVLKALHDSMRGGEVLTALELGRRLRLGFEEVEEVLGRLAGAGWVRKLAGEGWALVRDPDQIRVAEVFRLFAFRRQPAGGDERVEALLGELDARVGEELGMSLRQLFSEPRAVDVKRAG